MTPLTYLSISMLIVSAILFARAFMFFGEQFFLFKEKIEMKDIFAYRLSRITFTITVLLTFINMVI